jgi:hypothetical protein
MVELSRMVGAIWVDPARSMAASIATISLRECALLDEVWAARDSFQSVPRIKRRHRLFLSELLAYYCCVCEQYLDLNDGDSARVMDAVSDETARLATVDPFIMRAPYYRADIPSFSRPRYLNRITERRAKHGEILPWLSRSFLAARTALELRLVMSGATDNSDLSDFEIQLARRLEWTANELIGD